MISLTQVLIWIVIAAVIGVDGELLARRRAPDGILDAILLGLLAIFLIGGSLASPGILRIAPPPSSFLSQGELAGRWLEEKQHARPNE